MLLKNQKKEIKIRERVCFEILIPKTIMQWNLNLFKATTHMKRQATKTTKSSIRVLK